MERIPYSSYQKAVAAEAAARSNHYEEEIGTESFWKMAAASLPPHAQRKYAHLFEAAERYEPVVDFIVDRCRAAARIVSSHKSRVPGARASHSF